MADTPNFAGKHKRATSKSKKRSISKNIASRPMNKDLLLGQPEKENAKARPSKYPMNKKLDNESKVDVFQIQSLNAEDISFQFPNKDAFA